jgi:hypothetical protein
MAVTRPSVGVPKPPITWRRTSRSLLGGVVSEGNREWRYVVVAFLVVVLPLSGLLLLISSQR